MFTSQFGAVLHFQKTKKRKVLPNTDKPLIFRRKFPNLPMQNVCHNGVFVIKFFDRK